MKLAESTISGLVPRELAIASSRILLDSLIVEADIGFHDFEVGHPQRLAISAEIWLDASAFPEGDDPEGAWNYDFVRSEILRLACARRYNLQETLGKEVFERLSALHGVQALRLRLSKPDVYPDADGVGIEFASFRGLWPET